MLRFLAKLLRIFATLPFAVLAMFLPAAPLPAEEPVIRNAATDFRVDLAHVKRWASATIRGKDPPIDGHFRKWLRGLNLECAYLIAYANPVGLLEGHLKDTNRIAGLPPVHLDTTAVREWLRDVRIARRRRAEAFQATPSPLPGPLPGRRRPLDRQPTLQPSG